MSRFAKGCPNSPKNFELKLLENKIAKFNLYARIVNASMTSIACEIDLLKVFGLRT